MPTVTDKIKQTQIQAKIQLGQMGELSPPEMLEFSNDVSLLLQIDKLGGLAPEFTPTIIDIKKLMLGKKLFSAKGTPSMLPSGEDVMGAVKTGTKIAAPVIGSLGALAVAGPAAAGMGTLGLVGAGLLSGAGAAAGTSIVGGSSKDIALEFSLGAIGEPIARGLASTYRGLKNAYNAAFKGARGGKTEKIIRGFRRSVDPAGLEASMELQEYAFRQGINLDVTPGLTLDQLTNSPIVDFMAALTHKHPVAAKRFLGKVTANRTVTKRMLDDLTEDVTGEIFSAEDMGGLLKSAAKNRSAKVEQLLSKQSHLSIKEQQKKLDELRELFQDEAAFRYQMVDDVTKGTFRKDPILGTSTQIEGSVDLSESIGRAKVLSSPAASKIETLTSEAGSKINAYLSRLPDKLPFSEAHRVRSQLLKMRRMYDKANPADPAIGQIGRTIKEIDSAMETAAAKLKGTALSTWRTANAFYKGGAEKYLNEDIVKFLVKDPDQLAETLITNSNLPTLKALKRAFAKEAGAPAATKEWNSVVDIYFKQIIKKARLNEGDIGVDKLINLFSREKEGLASTLLGPEELKVFKQIIRENPDAHRRIGDAILKQVDPIALGNKLTKEGNILYLRTAKQLFKPNPDKWKLVQKGFFENLIEQSTKRDPTEITTFIDGNKLMEAIENKSAAIDILFTGPKEKLLVHRLKKIAITIQQAEKKAPSSFGALMFVIKAAGALGKGAKAVGRTFVGDPTGLPGAAAEIGIFGGFPKIIGEIVTDDKATHWLISGLAAKADSPAQRKAFINLENFIKSAIIGTGAIDSKEADFQKQIQEFQKTLNIQVGSTP